MKSNKSIYTESFPQDLDHFLWVLRGDHQYYNWSAAANYSNQRKRNACSDYIFFHRSLSLFIVNTIKRNKETPFYSYTYASLDFLNTLDSSRSSQSEEFECYYSKQ